MSAGKGDPSHSAGEMQSGPPGPKQSRSQPSANHRYQPDITGQVEILVTAVDSLRTPSAGRRGTVNRRHRSALHARPGSAVRL